MVGGEHHTQIPRGGVQILAARQAEEEADEGTSTGGGGAVGNPPRDWRGGGYHSWVPGGGKAD